MVLFVFIERSFFNYFMYNVKLIIILINDFLGYVLSMPLFMIITKFLIFSCNVFAEFELYS